MAKDTLVAIDELLASDEFDRIDPSQHAVLICLEFSHGKLDTDSGFDAAIAFEDILRDILDETVGEVDGNEFCEDSVTYFIYGQDADLIYEQIEPLFAHIPYIPGPGSYILKQYGTSSKADQQIFLT